MGTKPTSGWRLYTRLAIAWTLVLFGSLAAYPALEVVLRERFDVVTSLVFILLFGSPAIVVWSIAWWVRVGRLPHAGLYFGLGILFALAAAISGTGVWPSLLYFAGGGVLATWRYFVSLIPLPRTPQELSERLADLFPGFLIDTREQSTVLAKEDSFAQVFDVFAAYFTRMPPRLAGINSGCWACSLATACNWPMAFCVTPR